MKWFEPGDLVRYPHGKRLGVVTHCFEKLVDDNSRRQYKILILFGQDERHTVCNSGLDQIVLVKESQRLGKKKGVEGDCS